MKGEKAAGFCFLLLGWNQICCVITLKLHSFIFYVFKALIFAFFVFDFIMKIASAFCLKQLG